VSSYYLTCVLILLYICPNTTIYVSSYYHICVLILLYMCPHTTIYVSSYYYIYMCPDTTIYVSLDYYVCPHTTIYVSSYYSIYSGSTGGRKCINANQWAQQYHQCVLILLHMCPHTTIYVSSYCIYITYIQVARAGANAWRPTGILCSAGSKLLVYEALSY
jgi:hypothetical protein